MSTSRVSGECERARAARAASAASVSVREHGCVSSKYEPRPQRASAITGCFISELAHAITGCFSSELAHAITGCCSSELAHAITGITITGWDLLLCW